MNEVLMGNLIFWCGVGHLVLCIGSLYIPLALHWKTHLQNLQPLLRQIFWTYAGYILVINLSFGLISIFGNTELLNHTFLAKSLTFFIGIYWLSRVAIQFLYFDRSDAPKGLLYTLGEIALVGLFSLFTLTYLAAFCYNHRWI
jgi:hypothetical protein